MAGRVDKIEGIGLTILRFVQQTHGLCFDGDAALTLDIHRIEHLAGHFALLQATAHFDHAIRQSRFAMVNMGDDGKITDMREIGHLCLEYNI